MIIDTINKENNIIPVLKKYTRLHKENGLWYGKCPGCKSGGLVASEPGNSCHCFSCRFGGTPAEVIMICENILFKEIASFADIDSVMMQNALIKGNLFVQINEMATKFYEDLLYSPGSESYREYLYSRGLTDDIIKRYRIGITNGRGSLKKIFHDEGISTALLKEAGIINYSDNYRFYNRIIFPLIDYRGFVMGFTGRSLEGDPKYLNSPRSSLYDKSTYLYGLDKALPYIIEQQDIILVEGQMDLISMQTSGFAHTVGLSGTAFTEQHVTILGRLDIKSVTLCFDKDDAGVKATERAIEMLVGKGFDVFILQSILEWKDPSDHFLKGGTVSDFYKLTPIQWQSMIAAEKKDLNGLSE